MIHLEPDKPRCEWCGSPVRTCGCGTVIASMQPGPPNSVDLHTLFGPNIDFMSLRDSAEVWISEDRENAAERRRLIAEIEREQQKAANKW